MLTIRYLQLWNPLHQCQSGQPHRWVQQRPLQEVHGRDRFSRWRRLVWWGAPEHHSMTYDLEASCTSSNPLAIDALNCCHRGLVETNTGFTRNRDTNFLTSATSCRETRLSQLLAITLMWLQKKSLKKKHQNAIVDELLPLRGKTGKISITWKIFFPHWSILAFFCCSFCIVTLFCFLIQWLKFVSFFLFFPEVQLQYDIHTLCTFCLGKLVLRWKQRRIHSALIAHRVFNFAHFGKIFMPGPLKSGSACRMKHLIQFDLYSLTPHVSFFVRELFARRLPL